MHGLVFELLDLNRFSVTQLEFQSRETIYDLQKDVVGEKSNSKIRNLERRYKVAFFFLFFCRKLNRLILSFDMYTILIYF